MTIEVGVTDPCVPPVNVFAITFWLRRTYGDWRPGPGLAPVTRTYVAENDSALPRFDPVIVRSPVLGLLWTAPVMMGRGATKSDVPSSWTTVIAGLFGSAGSRVGSGLKVLSRYFERTPTMKLSMAATVSTKWGAMNDTAFAAAGDAPRLVRTAAAETFSGPPMGRSAVMIVVALGIVKLAPPEARLAGVLKVDPLPVVSTAT